MEWKENILTFFFYAKPNHTIKYVGSTSYHHPAVFKAVLAGVFKRLGRLTSITMENINQPITELYPAHMSALQNDRILPNKIPSVKELQAEEIPYKQQALADINKDNKIPKETLPVIPKRKYGLPQVSIKPAA
eukprot:15367148-Ditylum_brightwellii.AAC.1